jgi:hypothetical protein
VDWIGCCFFGGVGISSLEELLLLSDDDEVELDEELVEDVDVVDEMEEALFSAGLGIAFGASTCMATSESEDEESDELLLVVEELELEELDEEDELLLDDDELELDDFFFFLDFLSRTDPELFGDAAGW